MKKILPILLCLNIFIMPAFCLIEDEFVENSLDKNLKIKEKEKSIITDDFAESNKLKNNILKSKTDLSEIAPVNSNENRAFKKVAIIDEKDFIPVKIRIKSNFSTKDGYDEGDFIDFETIEDITVKGKNYPKGTTIKARVETISKNQTRGVPSDLTIGNFLIDNNPLQGEINKTGANRSLWVRPMELTGDIFFGAGTLLMFIRGGHAKIKPDEVFTVYLKR